MDSFARCPAICCCWVEERLNPFRPGRIDCETYQELILIAGWIIGSDVISRVSTIMPRLEHEMILLAKKEGNENREAKKEGKLRWREARIDSVSGAVTIVCEGPKEKVVACVFLESGLASSSEGTLPTHGKQAPVAVRPELSRQESSETETSGTDYTDATRTDDPYRGSTSHGKNRRLMRALLQERKASPTDTEPGWGPPSNPSAEPSEAVTTFRRDRTRFAPPYLGAKKESLAVPTVVSSASKAAVTSNGSLVPVESRAKLDTASEALRQSISIISIIEPTALSLSGLAYRSVGFYPPGVRKQRRKRSTTPANRNRNRNQNSKASNRNWYISTSNRISSGQVSTPAVSKAIWNRKASRKNMNRSQISPVPENQIGRKDPEDSFEAA
ncbi:hypothetical protein L1987_88348 [Smallanthus sonchifolius]|nr:hypothetical protein L1987_89706 [Smallanthus sonchifolius]KAI3666199.1 hypothetical protein L1987_89313 [Smallanthus sonchifolius]KAI3668647.1 hypothetical protein L1987_88348 [Smallanthus sonchifolius]